MSEIKILIYGSKGWIGGQFMNILKSNNMHFVEGNSRVDNEKQLIEDGLKEYIDEFKKK